MSATSERGAYQGGWSPPQHGRLARAYEVFVQCFGRSQSFVGACCSYNYLGLFSTQIVTQSLTIPVSYGPATECFQRLCWTCSDLLQRGHTEDDIRVVIISESASYVMQLICSSVQQLIQLLVQFTNAIFNIITYQYLFVLLGIWAYDFIALKNIRNKYSLKYKHNKHFFFKIITIKDHFVKQGCRYNVH